MEKKIDNLKQEGNYEEAIKLLEAELYTVDGKLLEHQDICLSLCELYNQQAMIKIHNNHQEEALSYLKKAEDLSGSSPELLAITYNYYACYYKKKCKYRTALKYLVHALRISPTGDIYLNLCAVSSLLEKHDKALEYAMQAVILIQNEAFQAAYEQDFTTIDIRGPILAIAYHNVAVELEYLNRVIKN